MLAGRMRPMPKGKGAKIGADNWSSGRSSFGVCDSLFSSANIRKAGKIVYVDTGHAANLMGDYNVCWCSWLSFLHADNQGRCIDGP
jgi:hypothetical protein